MNGGFDTLRESVDHLDDLDLDTLTDDELHAAVVAVQHERQRLALVAARLARAWDRRMVWATDGSVSPAARLSRSCKLSMSTARVEMRRARQLEQMPELRQRITDGRMTMDHLAILSPCLRPWRARRYATGEAALLDAIEGLDLDAARQAVRYWCQRADAEAKHTDTAPPAAELQVSTTLDDTVVVNGMLDPIGGAIVKDELDRLEAEFRLADLAKGVERTPAERRAAALVEMAIRSRTAPADGRRPKPLFSVLLGDDSFRHLCELSGLVLTPEQMLPWITEAMYETILFDGPSTVVSVSSQRTFTGALRRAVEVRDRHCQHTAGCRVPAERCDVDHITPYRAGGVTSQSNGRLECRTHNRDPRKHDHGAVPRPERHLTRLDELRATIRWRNRHYYPDDDTDPDGPEPHTRM
jgi:hypothetical protein